MNNKISRSDYIKALQIINGRMEKDAGIGDMLRSGLGYLQSGATSAMNYGRGLLDFLHERWHGLKDNPKTKKRLNALKAFNKGWEVLSDPDVKRIEAGINTVDGIDRTYHAIDNDTELKSGVRSVLNAAKDIATTGDVKKYLKKGVNKAHDVITDRYPSIKDTEDAAAILFNGPEKKSSYSLSGSIAKTLLKQAMYKKADAVGMLYPPSELPNVPFDGKDIVSTLRDLVGGDTKPLEKAVGKVEEKAKDAIDYVGDNLRRGVDNTKKLVVDTVTPDKDGVFGLGNTWMVDNVFKFTNPDEFYNTDRFNNVGLQLLNDAGVGSLTGAPATAAYYMPWAWPKTLSIPFKYSKWSVPIMVAGRLGTEFDRGLGTYNRQANLADRADTNRQLALVASGRNMDDELEGVRNYDRSYNDALVYLNNKDKWEREQNKSGIEKGKDALRHLTAIFTTHPYNSIAHYVPSMGWPEANPNHFPKPVEKPTLTPRQITDPTTMAIIRKKEQEKQDRADEEARKTFIEAHSGPTSRMNNKYVRPRVFGIF